MPEPVDDFDRRVPVLQVVVHTRPGCCHVGRIKFPDSRHRRLRLPVARFEHYTIFRYSSRLDCFLISQARGVNLASARKNAGSYMPMSEPRREKRGSRNKGGKPPTIDCCAM